MLFIIIPIVVGGVICACYCNRIAEEKGYSVAPWGWGGFFCGIFALIAIAGMPDRKEEAQRLRAEKK